MTVKLTISLPDHLAAVAQAQPNTSAYIAEAIRRRVQTEALHAAMKGLEDVPPEELERWMREREEFKNLRDDPDFRAANEAKLEQWRQGIIP